MTVDWTSTDLADGLAQYSLLSADDLQKKAAALRQQDIDVAEIYLTLDGLETYVETWEIEDGVWLVMAVVRMVSEILEDYEKADRSDLPLIGGDPTQEMVLLVPLAHEQEIAHRLWTAYDELYALLSRTQRKSGEKFWHRRATVENFPQIIIELADANDLQEDNPQDTENLP